MVLISNISTTKQLIVAIITNISFAYGVGNKRNGQDTVFSNIQNNELCSRWRGTQNTEKIEALNKRILRLILDYFECIYNNLLDKVICVSLYSRRIHNTLILLYKRLFLIKYPIYMRNMFTLCTTSYNLRGNYILTLPVPKTFNYGLRSFPYHAAKQWNSLPNFV